METKAALPLRRPWSSPSVARAAWTLLLLSLFAVGAKLVVSVATEGYRHGVVPYDLEVFLRAAHAVLDGVSPYPPMEALHGDANYVYPPLLALVVTPLATVSIGLAVAAWTLLSAAAVLLALRLLGVRDWRCYGIVFLLPPTRSAIYGGTVGPLLLLAIALAWHYRDRRPVALAVAAAVTLKLFLWPLVVWLAATRRIRAAPLAAGVALALALGSWAVIGFRGIGEYPDLLRRLAENEAASSYSLVALGEALGLPGSVASVLAILAGAALLAAAVAAGRRHDDRAALTYAIAAALALTPIAWLHYFILLLVPIALARPRLSPLWLAPLPLKWLVGGGWPDGDVGKLLVMLALCALVVVVTVRRRGVARLAACP